MALEMKVYREIAAYEPKPMFGRTWRQIAALAFMVGIGGGAFAGVTVGLMGIGQTMEQATTVGMYVMFPLLIPAAMWGWWRPMGLKPEQYLGFFLRHHLMRKTISYADTFEPQPGNDSAGEPVPVAPGEPAEPTSRNRSAKQRRAAARKLRKTITEHPQAEAARRRPGKARRAPQPQGPEVWQR